MLLSNKSRQQKFPLLKFLSQFSSGEKEQDRLQESQQEANHQEQTESVKQEFARLNHQTKRILSQVQKQHYQVRLRLDEFS